MLFDLERMPGWPLYCQMAAQKIQALRDIHEDSNLDKDATWGAKLRLQAVKDFQRGMESLVRTAKDMLDPEAMKRIVESVNGDDEWQTQ